MPHQNIHLYCIFSQFVYSFLYFYTICLNILHKLIIDMYLNCRDLNVLLLCLIFSIRLFQLETVTHNSHNTRFILKINQWCLPMEKPDFFY